MADGVVSSFMNITGAHLPRGDFFELVKAIGEAKSKQEEDRIIMDEMAVLKQKMPTQATFSKKMKEYLVRLIYCEMLGHDASFGYIKAVELSASTNLLQKRVGYLAASLCLSPEHEFRFMLVNQFTRDMASINYLEVCAALGAVCRLTTTDTIPAVINDVINKLKHDQELVRKKAVMALQKFHSLQPTSIAHLDDKIRRTLCDKDPSVMAAVLCLLLDLIKENPLPYKDLVPSFVSILKQITDHRLPRDYDYHRIPAPWVQIHLLRILAILGQSDQKTSEGMYEVLVDVMRRADTGINVGYAIVYECVRTVTTIYPNTVLLDAAASSIARFIGSDNHNLKYLGVKGLAAIVKDHPRYAAQHQLAVIDCLEDPDETLKRKTLDLLHRMTNSVNVEFITAKLLEFLEKATDVFLRTDLVARISQSSERYAPSNSWYIQTMTRVFLLAGELVKPEVPHTLMQLIAEGTGEDEEADTQLRKDAVENYVSLLDVVVLPDVLVQTMSWILGEYGYLSKTISQEELIAKLCQIANRTFSDSNTRGFVIGSVVKLVAQTGACPPGVTALLELYCGSINLDLQQRCFEYVVLLQNPSVMVTVLPVDASCEDVGVDESLSFLDSFVQEAVQKGAPQYSPPADHEDEYAPSESKDTGPALKLTPYAKPERPAPIAASPMPGPSTLSGVPGSLPVTAAGPFAGGPSAHAVPSPLGAAPPLGILGPRPGFKPTSTVWTRQGAMPAASAMTSSQPPISADAARPYGGSGNAEPARPSSSYSHADPIRAREPVDEKPRELTEKEKMAQALFGGLGGAPPPQSVGLQRPGASIKAVGTGGGPWTKSSPSVSSSSSTQAPAPARAAPAVDLLDLGFDTSPAPQVQPARGPAPAGSSATKADSSSSMFSDLISGGDLLGGRDGPVTSVPKVVNPANSPSKKEQQQEQPVDPFASLEGVTANKAPAPLLPLGQEPLSNRAAAFVYGGRSLQPLAMTTPDFGAKWPQMRFQAPAQVSQTTIRSLELLVSTLASPVGLHVVQSIPRTGEVIAAGRLGSDGDMVLVHTKLHTQRGAADCLVKCNDNGLAQSLCAYLRSTLVK